jgi:hypothetical protein
MPGLNHKGPEGAGPMTGNRRGLCKRTGESGMQGQGPNQDQGPGKGVYSRQSGCVRGQGGCGRALSGAVEAGGPDRPIKRRTRNWKPIGNSQNKGM